MSKKRRLPTFIEFIAWLGVKLTPAQRIVSMVAFDGVQPKNMTPEDRELSDIVFGGIDHVDREVRSTFAAVCGARAGKTYIFSALRLLHLALTVDISELAPGEIASGVIMAPDMRLAKQCFRYIKGIGPIKPELQMEKWDGGDSGSVGITVLRHDQKRVAIECLPASRGGAAARGRTLVGAVLDECAFFRDEEYTVNDEECYEAVSARILPDGQIILPSTPWVEGIGMLWKLHKENFDRRDDQGKILPPVTALVAHAPSLLLRPNSLKLEAMVEKARKVDPDNAAREYDAIFMPPTKELFFDPNAIERAVSYDLLPRRFDPTWPRCVAADFGFKYDSSTAMCIAFNGTKYVVVDMLERRPTPGQPLKPSEVTEEIARFAQKYGCRFVIADSYSREAIREYLSAHGLGIQEPPEGITGKMETYARAKAMLHQDRCEIPDSPRLKNQMRAITARGTAGGKLSIQSPRKKTQGHGDLVSAWVLGVHKLAWQLVQNETRGPEPGSPEYEAAWCRKEAQGMLERAMARVEGKKESFAEDDYEWRVA